MLADLGYEGENARLNCPFTMPAGGGLPVRIGATTAAALVLLHHDNGRTT